MCEQIARRLGLDEDRCQLLRDASPLHDIGKIAIPDDILLKRGPFTDEERRTMQRHAEIGHRLLSGSASEVLDLAATIALTHHERWDGNGYPYGIAGEAIPLEGRIASVADVFDALTADRVYRQALPAEEALAMMREQRGAQFDPLILGLLEELVRETEHHVGRESGSGDVEVLEPGLEPVDGRASRRPHSGDAAAAPGRARDVRQGVAARLPLRRARLRRRTRARRHREDARQPLRPLRRIVARERLRGRS